MQKEVELNHATIFMDATDAILGRLSTKVAKYLLEGKKVNIINCEKAVISGKKQSIVSEYKKKYEIHTASNPRRGPFHQKRPDRLVRRTIRGMLPYKKSSGRTAYSRLRVYIGIPEAFKEKEYIKSASNADKLNCKFLSIGDLCRELGWQS